MSLDLCLSEDGRKETREKAFPQLPLAVQPTVSFGLPFDELFVHHILLGHERERVFIMAEVPISLDPDKSIKIPTAVKRLQKALGPFPYLTWYAGVKGNWDDVMDIVQKMRGFAADSLVVVGGDFVIDLAKVVLYAHSRLAEDTQENLDALLRPTSMEMNDSRGERLVREEGGDRPPLPLFCIPTTCGGAAYSKEACAFNKAAQRFCTLVRTANYPKLVILDGSATMATPHHEWHIRGVEAINHAIEGILSINTNPQLVCDLTTAFKWLCVGLLGHKMKPESVGARSMALRGSNLAMTPLASQVPWGASHAFCNAAQRVFLTEPSLMAAVVLPAVLEWSAHKIRCQPSPEPIHKMRAQHHGLLRALWETKPCRSFFLAQGLVPQNSNTSQMLRVLFRFLGLPDNLAALGITTKSQRELLAIEAVRDPCARTAPVVLLYPEHALPILERVKGAEGPEFVETPTQQQMTTVSLDSLPVGYP